MSLFNNEDEAKFPQLPFRNTSTLEFPPLPQSTLISNETAGTEPFSFAGTIGDKKLFIDEDFLENSRKYFEKSFALSMQESVNDKIHRSLGIGMIDLANSESINAVTTVVAGQENLTYEKIQELYYSMNQVHITKDKKNVKISTEDFVIEVTVDEIIEALREAKPDVFL